VKPHLSRHPAVDVDVELRVAQRLLQPDVDGSGDLRDPPHELLRDRDVARIPPDDLDVDGRREPEVQDLRHDVGGLEEEDQVREPFAQDRPQLLGVRGGRPVLRLERDQDVAVGSRHERRVAEGQVDAASRQADVVEHGVDLVGRDDLPDHVLDVGEAARGFLQAGAVRRSDVQAELPCVDRREEVHADQPEEREGDRHEAGEDAGHDAPVRERPREERAVPVPQALEAPVECLVHRPDGPRIGDGVLRARSVQVRLGREAGSAPWSGRRCGRGDSSRASRRRRPRRGG
jgi:hypothetical protein